MCEAAPVHSKPERLLRVSLLQAFYSVRSERQLMEQINYNLLFRWFVGLGIDDAVFGTASSWRPRRMTARCRLESRRHRDGPALPSAGMA
jgi:hypothetical protein